jgi:hypothetical protein
MTLGFEWGGRLPVRMHPFNNKKTKKKHDLINDVFIGGPKVVYYSAAKLMISLTVLFIVAEN